MKAGGGKGKGSGFERAICKDLSLWITNNKKEDVFWRSAMSGGRSTVALRAGKKLGAQAGDISSVHKAGNAFIETFMVECKNYQKLNFESLVKRKGKLLEFWKIASQEASRYNKIPMLVAKQNHYPTVVCFTTQGMQKLGLDISNKIVISMPEYDMLIMHWNDFLEINPKKMDLSKTRKKRIRL